MKIQALANLLKIQALRIPPDPIPIDVRNEPENIVVQALMPAVPAIVPAREINGPPAK